MSTLCYNNYTIKKGNDTMKHYLFVDFDTGEDFIVGADNREEALATAREYFTEPVFQCELSDIEAEISGLDEY